MTWKTIQLVASLSRLEEFFTLMVPSESTENGADSGEICRVPTNPPW